VLALGPLVLAWGWKAEQHRQAEQHRRNLEKKLVLALHTYHGDSVLRDWQPPPAGEKSPATDNRP